MSYYDEVKTADALIEELRGRIAELEAENERLKKLLKSAEVINNQQYDRAEQAEDKLADLKTRICEGCSHYSVGERFCNTFTRHEYPAYYCNRWQLRV